MEKALLLALLYSAPLLARQDPATATAICAEADRLAADRQFGRALQRYGDALVLDPDHAPALRGRAIAHEDLGHVDAAMTDVQRCLRLAPGDAVAVFARGRLHYAQADHARALADFQRAAELAPEDARIHAWSGQVHHEAGRHDRAVTEFERALAAPGQEPWVHRSYGYSLWATDQNTRAAQVLRGVLAREPASHWALDLLATVEHELGNHVEALRLVDAALELEPEAAGYHQTRASILRALGRSREADAAAHRAAQLDPDSAGAGEPGLEALLGNAIIFLTVVALLGVLTLVAFGLRPGVRPLLEAHPRGHLPARFDGRASDLFRIYLQNVTLTLLTLGVYRFWAKVRVTRYRHQHTSFAGGRFDHHATGREKFIGFCKGLVVLAPVLGAIYVEYRLLVPEVGANRALPLCFWTLVLVLLLLRPLLLVGKQRFNLSRTSWSNLRFRFTGKVGDAYRLHLRDLPLIIGTLGIYLPWHQCNVRRFRMQHTKLGDLGFDYRGEGRELFRITLVGGFLCYVTLGIYVPWQIAAIHRFHVTNTTLRGVGFRSHMTGGMVLAMCVPALFASVLTLGLAIPWAITRWYRISTDTTSYPEPIDPSELRSIQDAAASAIVEGIGEAGDAIADLGEAFGA